MPFDLSALVSGFTNTGDAVSSSAALDALKKRNQAAQERGRANTTALISMLVRNGGGASMGARANMGGASSSGGGGGSTPTRNGPGKGLTTITLPNGSKVTVASNYASKFQGLTQDLWNAGYKFKSVGGYSYRNIAGTNRLSKHATGEAIDIDPGPNKGTRLGGGGNPYGYFNPQVAIKLARKWGLDWGGTWKGQEDPMHFSTGG